MKKESSVSIAVSFCKENPLYPDIFFSFSSENVVKVSNFLAAFSTDVF